MNLAGAADGQVVLPQEVYGPLPVGGGGEKIRISFRG